MKSIKTTIGGALGTLGTTLTGFGTLSALNQFNGTGNISKMTFYFVVSGFVLSAIGKFFTALFAADNSEVQRALADHEARISKVAGDTTQLTREIRGG